MIRPPPRIPISDRANGRPRLDPRFRFHLLDISRGAAALAVLAWHYQQFYFVSPGVHVAGFERNIQPLYRLIWPLYEYGLWGVQLFFVLSGFIFFHVYGYGIADRSISISRFFWLRFSRLYPLHFATLLMVASGQGISQWLTQSFIVYPINDLPHFLMNLMFVSHWGFQSGWSFNAPVWSVSVEVLLYGLFVTAMWNLRSAAKAIMFGIVIGSVGLALHAGDTGIELLLNRDISVAIMCFFMGGALYKGVEALHEENITTKALFILIIASSMIYLLVQFGFNKWVFYFGVFPSLVLLLAIVQTMFPESGKKYRLIGDISYSSYLIHFPLQLAIILVLGAPLPDGIVASPLFLLSFVLTVTTTAVLLHRHFEMPAQSYLRGLMERRRSARSGRLDSRAERPT